MKWQLKVGLILLSVAAVAAAAQSPSSDPTGLDTQARGYWVDPSTGIMWAGKDNGGDVNWRQATDYCGNLQLARHSDWRLPTILELRGIYEWNANAAGEIPLSNTHEVHAYTFDIKGNIFLTGDPWSSSRFSDDPGHTAQDGWYLNFNRAVGLSKN